MSRSALILGSVLGALFVVWSTFPSAVEAQDVPGALSMPVNDGGFVVVPPRQFTPVRIDCGGDQMDVIIQNANDTDQNPNLANVRVGSHRVRAYPAGSKNGIVVEPGQSVPWTISQGEVYGVSESTTDAGVRLGVVCAKRRGIGR